MTDVYQYGMLLERLGVDLFFLLSDEKLMEPSLKRISLLLREDQYQRLSERGLNVSGLVRGLIDDYFSDHRITIGVSEETRDLYDRIVANTGSSDAEVERYFRDALKMLLRDRIKEMQLLEAGAFRDE